MCRNGAAKVRKNIKMASVFCENFTKCHCIILLTSAKCVQNMQHGGNAPRRVRQRPAAGAAGTDAGTRRRNWQGRRDATTTHAGWARPRATPKRYDTARMGHTPDGGAPSRGGPPGAGARTEPGRGLARTAGGALGRAPAARKADNAPGPGGRMHTGAGAAPGRQGAPTPSTP